MTFINRLLKNPAEKSMSYCKQDITYLAYISEVMNLGCTVAEVYLCHFQGPENAVCHLS